MSDMPRDAADADGGTSDLQPTLSPTTPASAPLPAADEGPTIGPYRLLEKIGDGGMGEVWLAGQSEPVRRQVALKLIKLGMDTVQVVARFEAERQALALMDHPAIARVYDAGATPRGRPYFVMEHVRGVPITEYCDRNKMSTAQRLELFVQVCEGVQHAHQKAIIHRDLKPANVLVSVLDGRPVPKIIDFGVAKAVAQKLSEATIQTQLGARVGTPAYMSPEQAGGAGEDVDTRSDVYSLGVMLYELLVGALPFDWDAVGRDGLDAMMRRSRETEPPRPSTRLTSLGERSTESARRRSVDLPALKRQLSGDLDWITMKALEKDRARRYASPLELAADIRRYLTHQPVLARAPSTAYRAGKFVRRHTAGVAVAAVALLVLVTFAVVMTVQAGRIAKERDRANDEAAAKGQVSEFLKNLFSVSDPGEARGNSITARELLDRGADKIRGTLADQPEVRAELMGTIGDVYSKLGLYPQAAGLLEEALAEQRKALGDEDPRTLASMVALAALQMRQGRADEAERLNKEAIALQTKVLGPDHPNTLRTMGNLASLYMTRGRFAEAEPLMVQSLAGQERALGPDHHDVLKLRGNLMILNFQLGRYDEAEKLQVRNLEAMKRVLGEDHHDTIMAMSNLAELYRFRGRYDEAEPLFVESIANQTRVLGADHPERLRALGNLANMYATQGRHDRAEPLLLEVLAANRRVLGDEHPSTLIVMHRLGTLYGNQGRHEEAESLLLKTIAIQKRVLGPDSLPSLDTTKTLTELYRTLGRYDEAESMTLKALETLERTLGADHPSIITMRVDLAELYHDMRRLDESRSRFEQALQSAEKTLGPDDTVVADVLEPYAALLTTMGEDAKVAEMRKRAEEIRGK